MEELETNDKDRPKNPPKIEEVIVFSDPFVEAKEALESATKEAPPPKKRVNDDSSFFAMPSEGGKPGEAAEVGRYVKPTAAVAAKEDGDAGFPRKAARKGFDFSGW
eukprot:Selendium_serpulae@DN5503_c0_g1_i3.p2